MSTDEAVASHYTHGTLIEAIRQAVSASGLAVDRLTAADLAPVDEFHIGGRPATLDFAQRLGFAPGSRLLDVGSGIGGPARCVAETANCRVTGIDLTEEYVRTAIALSEWVGLSDRLSFFRGSALALPFEAGAFDGAYMLHVGMNVPDKGALAAEVARVVKPGGVFGVYDVMRTGEAEPDFPVPWSATPATSFLAAPGDYRDALASAGFEVTVERDRREFAREFFATLSARAAQAGGPPPLGLHLVMGADASTKIANMVAGIEAGRVAPVELIARRRG